MIIPSPKLPPGSIPWATTVTQESTKNAGSVSSAETRQRAFMTEQSATTQLLTEQLNALAEQVEILPIIQAAQVDILGPGFVGNNIYSTLYTITVPFPAGKTIADVMAFGTIRGGNPGVAGTSIFFRVGINGVYGPDTPADHNFMSTLSYAEQVTGAGSVTITGQGMATAGSIVDTRVSLNGLISFK